MRTTCVGWRIINQLHLLLQVETVTLSKAAQKHRMLRGLPLKCEEERLTEIKVFELAFARYFGDDLKTGKPGGTYLGRLKNIPQGDQRLYEMSMYADSLRLYVRGRRKRGVLPEYILKAYRELLSAQHSQRKARDSFIVTKSCSSVKIAHLDTAA